MEEVLVGDGMVVIQRRHLVPPTLPGGMAPTPQIVQCRSSTSNLSFVFREPRRLGWLMNTVRSRMWGRIKSRRRGGRLIIQQSPEFRWVECRHWWGGGFIIQQLPEFHWVERHHWWGGRLIIQQSPKFR
ncbi:hypothetical protein, partial [Mesorhizobium escarrei]|uniref:hypothetical protein n=1 Tax=Mesorhizobium escarrei TaxID=666018 RepID=UPI003F52FD32